MTKEQFHDRVFFKVAAVYRVFQDFFGEQFVDLQSSRMERYIGCAWDAGQLPDATIDISDHRIGKVIEGAARLYCSIYVYWPHVTVTNENDRSVVIDDLYALVRVGLDGKIPPSSHGFYLNRARYSMTQFLSDYSHSHLRGINKQDFSRFDSPCLGRGPIVGTINSLKNEFDETEWMLFCQELSMYVTVESLTGVPYRRLEEIGNKGYLIENEYDDSLFSNSLIGHFNEKFGKAALQDFIRYYLTNGHLKFNYCNNSFSVGMQYYDFMMDISNCFIDYVNNRLVDGCKTAARYCFNLRILVKAIVRDRRFYSRGFSTCIPSEYEGAYVLTFKGRDVNLSIYDDGSSREAPTVLLHHLFAMPLLNRILRTVNYRFKNERNQATTGGELPCASQNVLHV